jgi:hypothetical protein
VPFSWKSWPFGGCAQLRLSPLEHNRRGCRKPSQSFCSAGCEQCAELDLRSFLLYFRVIRVIRVHQILAGQGFEIRHILGGSGGAASAVMVPADKVACTTARSIAAPCEARGW